MKVHVDQLKDMHKNLGYELMLYIKIKTKEYSSQSM